MSTGIGVSSDGQQSNSNKAPRLKPTEALTDISRWVEVQDLPEVLEKSEGFLSDGLVKGLVEGYGPPSFYAKPYTIDGLLVVLVTVVAGRQCFLHRLSVCRPM